MAKKTSLTEYPWSPLLDHPDDLEQGGMSRYITYGRLIWKPNTPQKLTLTFKYFNRGRSATYAIFVDQHDRQWYMFLTDLEDAIVDPRWKAGTIEATWVVGKCGQNYGVRLFDDPES